MYIYIYIYMYMYIYIYIYVCIGKLITYQLYWNMMTSAYKGLLDILTSFTRAGGAAQRVFALIDSMPDIDVDIGKYVCI
jgi:ABC-type multidrug transport system fused ATPase/permease subunit